MAVEFVDNFKYWTTAPGPWSQGSGSVSGGRLALLSGTNNRIVLAQESVRVLNFRVNIGSLSEAALVSFWDGATCQCTLVMKSNGKLALRRGTMSVGTLIGSEGIATLAVDNNVTYHDIEVKITIHNSTGAIEVRLNGNPTPDINSTGLDTASTSNNFADAIQLGDNYVGGSPSIRYEHVIIMNTAGSQMNNFIGVKNVNWHPATADGNYTTWTPNTGTRVGALDDTAPNNDTDYVAMGTVGNKGLVQISDAPAGTTDILNVTPVFVARRDDAATRGFKPLLRASGTDNLNGAEMFLGSTYQFYLRPLDLSPFTSNSWGVSEFNGLEIGAEVTT